MTVKFIQRRPVWQIILVNIYLYNSIFIGMKYILVLFGQTYWVYTIFFILQEYTNSYQILSKYTTINAKKSINQKDKNKIMTIGRNIP